MLVSDRSRTEFERAKIKLTGHFSEGLMCLSTSGNYTQVEILTGNS